MEKRIQSNSAIVSPNNKMPEEEFKVSANVDRVTEPPMTPKTKRGFIASLFRKGPKKTKTEEKEESKKPSSAKKSFLKAKAKTNLPRSSEDAGIPKGPKTAA